MELVERIYCCDRDNNDNALAAAILANGNNRNGQRDLCFAITQGFSTTAFQAQQDKCDIFRAGQDNTQRIIDTLNNHWKDEQALKIQDLKFELSQERQNNLLLSRLGGNGCGYGQ